LKWVFFKSCKEEEEEKQIQVSCSGELNHTFLVWSFHLTRMVRVFCRKKKDPLQQTDPPSIPVDELFPSGDFPEGEIQQYKDE
jgi:hypothetical protein